MKGTHTLEQLRAIRGFRMTTNGIVITKYGRYTNYWEKCNNRLYANYDCKTTYYGF